MPISVVLSTSWSDKRETGLERPSQKAQTENWSQACAGGAVSQWCDMRMTCGVHASGDKCLQPWFSSRIVFGASIT